MWYWQEEVRFSSGYCSPGWLSHQANSTLWAMWLPGVLHIEEDTGNQDWTNWRSRCVYACVQAALHGWADCHWGHKDCIGPWQIHRDGESLEIGQYLTSACRFAVCNNLFMMILVTVKCWKTVASQFWHPSNIVDEKLLTLRCCYQRGKPNDAIPQSTIEKIVNIEQFGF